MWDHFTEDLVEGVAHCNYCSKQYKKCFSTSTMRKHTEKKHPEKFVEDTQVDLPIKQRIINWMISSLVPFHCIDSNEFKQLFSEPIPVP